MRPRMRVGTDADAIGLIGAPVDEAFMMVGDEHGPLRLRQLAHALLARSGIIERDVMAALAIGIGASIHGICQHMIDRDVAGFDPTDAAAVAGLQRKRETFAAKPQPDAAGRSEVLEPVKHSADGVADRLVGMESYFAVFLTPDEADGETPTQFAARGLVANPAVEAGAPGVQPRFSQFSLYTEQ